MCGLAGIVALAPGFEPSPDTVRAMIETIESRGPDAQGFFSARRIALGHARLAIIDLVTGDQPMHHPNGHLSVVFNGEIFNFLELREALIGQGHVFSTHSDTEVILHLYERYGDEFVHRLNGQFAIALWDARTEKLLLVRDRPGIVPLYYRQSGRALAFASEIKALLPTMSQAPCLNAQALDQTFTFWSPVAPLTMLDNVYELPPGMMMTVQAGKVTEKRYWHWDYPAAGQYEWQTAESAEQKLVEILTRATGLRLRADVPVGAYLSGGLDSSVIAALISRVPDQSLHTLSLGFNDEGVDERVYQQQVAEYLGTRHATLQISQEDIAADFEKTVWRTETPILRTAPVPMQRLSAFAKNKGFNVVLTGEGADETLGGYDTFKEAKVRWFWSRQPESMSRPLLLKRLYPYLPLQQLRNPAYLKSFFGQGLTTPDLPYFSHLPRWSNTASIKMFFADSYRQDHSFNAIESLMDTLPDGFMSWDTFNRAQYLEARTLLPGYLLSSQGDRMLMTNSVEGRYPFLDHELIEFANQLHPKLKMRALNEKYLLKRAAASWLPAQISTRTKQPYRAPDITAFTSQDSWRQCREQLSPSALRQTGYFAPERVERLLKKIEAGRAVGNKDNMAFVGILSTQILHQRLTAEFNNRPTQRVGHID